MSPERTRRRHLSLPPCWLRQGRSTRIRPRTACGERIGAEEVCRHLANSDRLPRDARSFPNRSWRTTAPRRSPRPRQNLQVLRRAAWAPRTIFRTLDRGHTLWSSVRLSPASRRARRLGLAFHPVQSRGDGTGAWAALAKSDG